jgi:hypothetical protein
MEAAKNNWCEGTLVVEEWLLIGYAVGTIPVNPENVVDVVSKLARPDDERRDSSRSVPIPSITLAELEKSMQKRIESIDISAIAQETIARMRGSI